LYPGLLNHFTSFSNLKTDAAVGRCFKLLNMNNSQEYGDLVKKMTMYLDNELPKNVEMELLREIKMNPGYMELLNKEKSFRKFVKSRVQRRSVSPALIQSIKEQIKIHPPNT